MKWFNNLRVKTKMVVSFLLVIALMAVVAVLAVTELGAVSEQYKYTIDKSIEAEIQMRVFADAANNLRRMTTSMTMYAPLHDAGKIDSYLAQAETSYETGLASIDVYRDILADSTAAPEVIAAALQNLDDLENTLTKYKTEVCDPIAVYARAGDYDSAIALIVEIGSEYGNILTEETGELIITAQTSAANNVAVAEEEATRTEWILIGISIASAVIALVIALYIASSISTPLIPLSAFMKKAGATGDLTLLPEDLHIIGKYSSQTDELGQTINGAASFVKYVTEASNLLSTIAEGDLSVKVDSLSDKDVMGLALSNMLDHLNGMFSDINMSASQVSVGSRQVSDGAQSLAQGSTEQASSIEQLSSSITEITDHTKQNVEMTEKAVDLAGSIKKNAEIGSRHMDDMIAAVNDINEASQSISKIIKTIDDIAFQTNILALNAAVEAARAGVHGKGFAVVAEEVRNLADKSAKAAKETSLMIEESVDKAATGAQIASETAESLTEILNGVIESTELIDKIAQASEEQSTAISQINIGVEQVSRVVHQNSATAEQSAAASQEMSSQSDVLQQLISRFKLSSSAVHTLPPEVAVYEQRPVSPASGNVSAIPDNKYMDSEYLLSA